jgi:hypothetical protein
LPSDLTHPEQLRDRVEWARRIGASSGVLIGAAIAAASVYEDVRYLIDSGFDYVCVLADGCYGPDPRQRVSFGDPERVVVQGLRAIGDSGHPNFGLHLAAAELDPKRMFAWLQAGVRAVCVDGLLQSASPGTSGRVGEGFGGFLGGYPRVEDPQQLWLPMAFLSFRQELQGELEFAGYSDLQRLRVDQKPIRVSKPTT